MKENLYLAMAVLLAGIVITRILNVRASAKLSEEKQAQLKELFAIPRILNFLIVLLIVLIFLLSSEYEWISSKLNYVLYFGLLAAFFVISAYRTINKLYRYDFPPAYVRDFIMISGVRFIGLVIFLTIILSDFFK
jgi:hypothetical protein